MNEKTPKNISDEMIDDFLDSVADQDIPKADPALKKQAINAASKEFSNSFAKENQILFQESSESARPIDNRNISSNNAGGWLSALTQSIRSFLMNPISNNSLAYKGFAAASVAFLAVSVVFLMPTTQTNTGIEDLAGVVTERSTIVNRPNIESKIEPLENQSTGSSNAAIDEAVTRQHLEETVVTARKTEQSELAAAETPATPKTEDQDFTNFVAEPFAAEPFAAEPFKNSALAESTVQQARTRIAGDFAIAPAPVIGEQEASVNIPRPDDREEYAEYQTNSIKLVTDEPVSTFSIDVDTASYSLVRNQLNSGYLPAPQAVRAEELINYFDYDYSVPRSNSEPFEPSVNVFDSPWNENKKLVHIGIKGYDIDTDEQPDSNLVFLLDVSGSMNDANKLPLVKQSVSLLLDTLKPTDTVSIVVYAGAAGTVLEPTEAKDKNKIIEALQKLNAGGSTAGGAGIQLAYQLAEQNFNEDGVNRIILATDGDFNVGQSSNDDLKTLVERKRSNGVFLSVLGFGRNNYRDDMMQTLAQNGNGVAAYIDSLSEAKKVLVDEATSTLFPIAKDVKIQVEFNPATVSEYRLIGYETRSLNREDFNNDKVDAGDIGAGHTVTAIYEITPADAATKYIDEPRYSLNRATVSESQSDEYGFLKIRYKLPDSDTSELIETAISANNSTANSEASFSVAVAGFAQLISNDQYTGDLDFDDVIESATEHKGSDPFGYRSEFIQLVRMAKIAQP